MNGLREWWSRRGVVVDGGGFENGIFQFENVGGADCNCRPMNFGRFV